MYGFLLSTQTESLMSHPSGCDFDPEMQMCCMLSKSTVCILFPLSVPKKVINDGNWTE